jgi:hypothetical protein
VPFILLLCAINFFKKNSNAQLNARKSTNSYLQNSQRAAAVNFSNANLGPLYLILNPFEKPSSNS